MILDDDLTDASALHGLGAKGPVAEGVDRSGGWDLAGEIEHKTGDRHVLALRNGDSQFLFNFVHVGLAIDEPTVFADPNDGWVLILVELVAEVADELLEDVADGNDAGDTTVFVEAALLRVSRTYL